MKAAATVLIAAALVIAAATVFIALQVSVMADRIERLEDVTVHNCRSNTTALLIQMAISQGIQVDWPSDLFDAFEDVASTFCHGDEIDSEPIR